MIIKLKQLGKLLIESFNDLQQNDPLRLAGATAFFCTFALPPMLIILIQLFGLVVDKKELGRELFNAISNTVGIDGERQIRTVFKGIKALAVNWYVTLAGFIFLLFVATTLFKVIKDSVNQLWDIRPLETRIQVQLYSRLKSLLVLGLAGMLFFASLLADGIQDIFSHYFQSFPGSFSVTLLIINKVISLVIFTAWFMLLFRYLPDAIVSWRTALTGGLLTAVLFTLGKSILKFMLPSKNITSIFGASGSFVLLLLFVFYSSFILYYGACFTKAYACFYGKPIKPKHNAASFKLTDIDVLDNA